MANQYPEGQEKRETTEEQYTSLEAAANRANPCETDGQQFFEDCQDEKTILNEKNANFKHGEKKYLSNVDTCTINDVIQLPIGHVITLDYTTVESQKWTVPSSLAEQREIHALSTASGFKVLNGPDHMIGTIPFVYDNINVTRKAKMSFVGGNEINIPNANPFKIHELVQNIGDIFITQGSGTTRATWKQISEGGNTFFTYADDKGRRVRISGEITITPDNTNTSQLDLKKEETLTPEVPQTNEKPIFDPFNPLGLDQGDVKIPFRRNEVGDVSTSIDETVSENDPISNNPDDCFQGLEHLGTNEYDIFTALLEKYEGIKIDKNNYNMALHNRYIDSNGEVLTIQESNFLTNLDYGSLINELHQKSDGVLEKYGDVIKGSEIHDFLGDELYYEKYGSYRKVPDHDMNKLATYETYYETIKSLNPNFAVGKENFQENMPLLDHNNLIQTDALRVDSTNIMRNDSLFLQYLYNNNNKISQQPYTQESKMVAKSNIVDSPQWQDLYEKAESDEDCKRLEKEALYPQITYIFDSILEPECQEIRKDFIKFVYNYGPMKNQDLMRFAYLLDGENGHLRRDNQPAYTTVGQVSRTSGARDSGRKEMGVDDPPKWDKNDDYSALVASYGYARRKGIFSATTAFEVGIAFMGYNLGSYTRKALDNFHYQADQMRKYACQEAGLTDYSRDSVKAAVQNGSIARNHVANAARRYYMPKYA